ncbi:hypothetical protein E2C01_070111 [Portunus trituberculatus]|uniref:Uncharacterized protein n=1 Tax=Portunus trituberculatus TaxID=210409 RepID=A0A5B7I4A4_PORTR|nr:hypothetical protein [Portunus trituberculatus]
MMIETYQTARNETPHHPTQPIPTTLHSSLPQPTPIPAQPSPGSRHTRTHIIFLFTKRDPVPVLRGPAPAVWRRLFHVVARAQPSTSDECDGVCGGVWYCGSHSLPTTQIGKLAVLHA